ncbi:MAG: hypothetical protein ACHQ4F_10395 [Candidatus Dormibacteria bacterium]
MSDRASRDVRVQAAISRDGRRPDVNAYLLTFGGFLLDGRSPTLRRTTWNARRRDRP